MRRLCELVFGKAAVVGARSMLGLPITPGIENDYRPPPPPWRPSPPILDRATCDALKREWERAYRGGSNRVVVLPPGVSVRVIR